MTITETDLPYRVVDRNDQGWYATRHEEAGIRYAVDDGSGRDLSSSSYGELVAARGPIRPVQRITAEDSTALRELFDAAGRRTVTTLAAALEVVFHAVRESRGGLASANSFADAKRSLQAGREGSWESQLLIEVVLFGNGLNLASPARGEAHDVAALRAAGPSKRVDAAVRDQLAAIFWRWVTDPARYTEIAQTLAATVSAYCDEKAGADGWATVADQWLQPVGLAREDFSTCYRLFYSLSEHFDPTVT